MKSKVERVEKPWGYELIWAHTPGYVGKLLHVNAGEALSLQYHDVKDETLFLLSGRLRFWIGPSREELAMLDLSEGEAVRVVPGTLHRIEALTDVDLLEASTDHLDDVVRLDDRYGRIPDREEA